MIRPFRRRKPKVDVDKYTVRWKELQQHCAARTTWPQAIIEADELLGDVLKKLRYKGKSTGERLVAAQHDLTDNENVWYGHKLYKHLQEEDIDVRTLKKKDMVIALAGYRQALRDLGALEK